MSRWVNSLILFTVSGLLAVVGMAFGVEIKGVSSTRQPLFDAFAAICGPHTMGQSFVATAPNLDRADLWLAWSTPQHPTTLTPTVSPMPSLSVANRRHTDKNLLYHVFLPIIARSPNELRFSTADYLLNAEGCSLTAPSDDSAIVISLKQSPTSSEALATASLRLDSVEDLAMALRRPYVHRSFTFPPIPDSAGRTFYLSIEAPNSSASAPLLARYHRGDVYTDGILYLDNAPATGDLAFRVHYGGVPMSYIKLLLNRLKHNRPLPFNWPWFYPTLLAAYAGSVALVTKAILQNLTHPED